MGVKQEWALVNGDPRHVTEFAYLAPQDRPRGICLECKKEVLFKCGQVYAHYVAHKEGRDCTAAAGEGAEHYNAKLKLTTILRKQSSLDVVNICAGCGVVNADPIKIEYDRVELEYVHPNQLRSDIALLNNGRVVGTIEIFVSHLCEADKIAFHHRAKIPCIEIHASYVDKWDPERFMSARSLYGVERWICWRCEERRSQPVPQIRPVEAPPVKAIVDKPVAAPKRRIIGVQKLFFDHPQAPIPYQEPFITIEFIEVRVGDERVYCALIVLEKGIETETIHELHAPLPINPVNELNAKLEQFIAGLESKYGPVRKGKWLPSK